MHFIRFFRLALPTLILLTLGLSSCDKEPMDPEPNYEIPELYNFDPADYSGQTTRLAMLNEMKGYMTDARTPGNTLDAQRLEGMYTNDPATAQWEQTYDASKQLKSKTFEGEQEVFTALFPIIAADSESEETASEGVAGRATSLNGNSTYLLSSNGIEYAQLIEKGLMGACLYYQSTAVYFGEDRMNADNETVDPVKGTAMEHHWDEAFGYFGVPIDFPTNTTGVIFWGNYANGRNALLDCNRTIMDGFLKGRAAISNMDYETRDEAIAEVRTEWERICAATAIHYLNGAAEEYDDLARRAHLLSEAIAFIYSLQFNPAKQIDNSTVADLLIEIAGSADFTEMNIYPITADDLLSARDQLAMLYELEDLKEDF